MAKCVDNERIGRIGCGATYFGEMQHCIAKVPWSNHSDGMAHITAPAKVIDLLWFGDSLRNPIEMNLEQDSRGVWRKPISESERKRLNALGRKADLNPSDYQAGRSKTNPVPQSMPCELVFRDPKSDVTDG